MGAQMRRAWPNLRITRKRWSKRGALCTVCKRSTGMTNFCHSRAVWWRKLVPNPQCRGLHRSRTTPTSPFLTNICPSTNDPYPTARKDSRSESGVQSWRLGKLWEPAVNQTWNQLALVTKTCKRLTGTNHWKPICFKAEATSRNKIRIIQECSQMRQCPNLSKNLNKMTNFQVFITTKAIRVWRQFYQTQLKSKVWCLNRGQALCSDLNPHLHFKTSQRVSTLVSKPPRYQFQFKINSFRNR